jgi:pimeloyl-ACP methyl ester carboxylesterase
MPVLSHGELEIEYSDAGDGPAVVLIHCSVSGLRQWRSLTESLSDGYRVRALNLYGYGATTPWPERETQTLDAQARLVVATCEGLGEPVALVGHSFGGTVALKAATLLGSRVGSMVLIEPNPVYLLAQGGRDEEFAEASALRDHVKRFGARGEPPSPSCCRRTCTSGTPRWGRGRRSSTWPRSRAGRSS